MSFISAHVLDASAGMPAVGIRVALYTADDELLADGVTDADGRVADLGPSRVVPGDYRVTFETGPYFADRGQPHFHPLVDVRFTVAEGEAHYHIPLLLSPFAYTTYRGS